MAKVMSTSTQPKRKSQHHPNAKKCLEARQVRRQLAVDVAQTASFLKEEEQKGDTAVTQQLDRIRNLMIESGVKFLDDIELKFIDPEARGGVEMSLQRLAYNPDSLKVDLTVPWCGKGLDPAAVLKLLDKKCKVQHWALRLKKSTLGSLTRPNVEGMLTSDGKPNKDLQQILDSSVFTILPEEIETLHWQAVNRIADNILAQAKVSNDPLFSINPISGKIILRRWTEEEIRVQMKKAFKASSPGYPYNRYQWNDVVDGQTVVRHAMDAFERLIADGADLEGFIYFQQSRATGDGGRLYEDADTAFGQQRLVQAAPLGEKLLGHLLAYVFKAYIKTPLLSGQNGIQEASRNLKALCQDIIRSGVDLREYHLLDYDVNQWDVAQKDKRLNRGFFAVNHLVFDKKDPFTARVLAVYETMHDKRRLVTGVGQIRCNFLPSGSSITTVAAFINHEIQILVVNDYCRPFHNGSDVFLHYGLQGDDNIAIVHKITEEDINRLLYIYSLYGSVIKGEGIALSSLYDADCYGVFLNEAIRIRDPIDEDHNAKFPRWNLFWAENKADQSRGANLDRMLYDEITKLVAHPTETELTFVSFISKMDRFLNMGFHDSLLRWILKRSVYPMKSWLGERTCPNSPTVAAIRRIEEEKGITWPNSETRANDRREEVWADGDELADMLSILWMLQEVSPEAKEVCRFVTRAGKESSKGWKRARKAMEIAGVSFEQNAVVQTNKAREFIKIAYEKGYLDLAVSPDTHGGIMPDVPDHPDAFYEAAEAMGVQIEKETPIVAMRPLMRGTLSLNETNPWKLRYLTAKAIISTFDSPGWLSLHESVQREIAEWFVSQYGIPLIASEDADNDADRLKRWLNSLNEEAVEVNIPDTEDEGN